MEKKKKGKGKLVFLIILLIILGVGAYFAASMFGVLPPKDLGVAYTEADTASALAKVGTTASLDGMSGDQLKEYLLASKGKKLNINDYNWQFSNYETKKFTLTPAEATALLNEIAPNFFWFDKLQVNILPDGTMQGSSQADIGRLKADLYADVASSIPIPIPDKVNLYGEGVISIAGNVLTSSPSKMEIGAVPLPEQYMTGENVAIASSYLQRIYTVVPGLEINSLKAVDGTFVFDGKVPQTVEITKK